MGAYNASKLAGLLFALELQRRSEAGGWGLSSNAAHPGLASTNLQADPRGAGSRAAALVADLERVSPEFAALWAAHDVGIGFAGPKRISHPEAGILDLYCQTLVDPEHAHVLLVFTAVPGSASQERLELLTVLGEARTDV